MLTTRIKESTMGLSIFLTVLVIASLFLLANIISAAQTSGYSIIYPSVHEFATLSGVNTTICYVVYGAAVPNTITINSTPVHITTINYITQNSVGLTVNGTSVLLNMKTIYTLLKTSNTVTTMDLINNSYLPMGHTVTYNLCTTTKAHASKTTTTANTNTTVKPNSTQTATVLPTVSGASSTSGQTSNTPSPSSSKNILVGAGLLILAIIVLALYIYRNQSANSGKPKKQKK